MELNQRPIPDAALRDKDAVEMLRVWIAENGLHCSMKIGMYQETMGIPEERAWGTILADIARHVSNAIQSAYHCDSQTALDSIKTTFLAELGSPSTEAKGEFLKRH